MSTFIQYNFSHSIFNSLSERYINFQNIMFILNILFRFYVYVYWCSIVMCLGICSIYGVLATLREVKLWYYYVIMALLFLFLYHEIIAVFIANWLRYQFFQFLPYYNYNLKKSNFSSIKMLMCLNFISRANFETKEKLLSLA